MKYEEIPLEDRLTQLDDIMTHIEFVMKAGHKLIKKLMIQGEENKAQELLFRIMHHDISKVGPQEFYGMAKYSKDVQSMRDPSQGRSPVSEKMRVIQLHWINNDHHPEFWIEGELPKTLNVEQPSIISEYMNEGAIMEMCCDWYARSYQFGSNLLDFYEMMQNKRWKFNKQQDSLIRKYIGMLIED